MKLIIDDAFRTICRTIVAEYQRDGEASLIDSDDLYQAPGFCGGWESSTGAVRLQLLCPRRRRLHLQLHP
jgi:hypothetical protein